MYKTEFLRNLELGFKALECQNPLVRYRTDAPELRKNSLPLLHRVRQHAWPMRDNIIAVYEISIVGDDEIRSILDEQNAAELEELLEEAVQQKANLLEIGVVGMHDENGLLNHAAFIGAVPEQNYFLVTLTKSTDVVPYAPGKMTQILVNKARQIVPFGTLSMP